MKISDALSILNLHGPLASSRSNVQPRVYTEYFIYKGRRTLLHFGAPPRTFGAPLREFRRPLGYIVREIYGISDDGRTIPLYYIGP